jgi:hypothetical protein
MEVFDPLVSIEPSARSCLRGWTVAAAIIAGLQEVELSGRIDLPAILDRALPDLSDSEWEVLIRQMSGPLEDTPRCFLGHPAREWLAASQVRPERRGDVETSM